ncbi:LysR family transcriptional regulator [Amorphus sp. 3PC139-8]|uniref:LysR family transcriptional regulator n=1 Tax=Amorphus sp. 3PC139-8 TaxID=2735676 RepID=UPI00345C7E79
MFPGPLRAFYEAVRSGSVRKASDRLGLAPSSVSRQILILERQMGVPLFDRSTSGVTVTHAGRLVAEYARSVILDYDSLREDLNGLKGTLRGLVRVACVEGAVSEVVQGITVFRTRYPDVQYQVRMLTAQKVVEAIKLGECDIGVTFCGRPDVELRQEARYRDPIVLVVEPGHRLAGAERVSIHELADLLLAVPEGAFNIRQVLEEVSQEAGHALNPVLTTDSFVALKTFARASSGASVMARMSVQAEVELGLLKTVPIDAPLLERTTIDLLTLKKRRLPSVSKFLLTELKRTLESVSLGVVTG